MKRTRTEETNAIEHDNLIPFQFETAGIDLTPVHTEKIEIDDEEIDEPIELLPEIWEQIRLFYVLLQYKGSRRRRSHMRHWDWRTHDNIREMRTTIVCPSIYHRFRKHWWEDRLNIIWRVHLTDPEASKHCENEKFLKGDLCSCVFCGGRFVRVEFYPVYQQLSIKIASFPSDSPFANVSAPNIRPILKHWNKKR